MLHDADNNGSAGQHTEHGFDWGPLKVRRLYSDSRAGVVVIVYTDHVAYTVRVTPGGRKIELKHAAVPTWDM